MQVTLIVIYFCIFLIPSVIIDMLQYRHISFALTQKPTILPKEDYIQAGYYALDKLKVSLTQHLFNGLLFAFWIMYGLYAINELIESYHLPRGRNLNCVIMVLAFILFSQILSIPFKYYTEMVLDKKYGFSKQSKQTFVIDLLKGLAMTIILGGGVLYLLVYTIYYFESWWIYGALLSFVVIVLVNFLYPTWIAPLFNTFTPLNDESLQARIEGLLVSVGFKSSGIFIMDASKRDGRLNAYFGGFGKNKRVVLFDTLLDKVSSDGLIAILGHELGHFKYKDLLVNLLISGIFLFSVFFVIGQLPQSFFDELELRKNAGNLLILLILLAPVVSFWFLPVIGFFSRRAEYRADKFGSNLASKQALAEALIRLVNENKSFPSSHPVYIFFYYTHPPLLQRLKALDYEF
ncbi:M48 family metallopeptidase [Helicobacter brantae]|uniref:Peptidase M48 n=1 Tax=Helicobacter brantae TaxID=375927 RepID=A0A3D8IUF0_9HELI|nr:M48 family metallopeptidase [Helicobacter brantae]RDU68852.1 peptidase M48 [Helicobacter brantae]